MAMPSVFAVFKLMTKSHLVGVCTGRSPGLSPRPKHLLLYPSANKRVKAGS